MSTGSISFGLVNIPVKLYSAANPSASVSFKLLSKDGHRLRQQYIDPRDEDRVVERAEMVKGYEIGRDQYVIFTDDELKELQETSTQTIDITEFVLESQVPKVYLQKTYYLGPDKGGDRAYALLSNALRETGRCGLAKYAARGKMYLVLVAPLEDGLAMYQLNYADEVVAFEEVPKGNASPKPGELELAIRLIEQGAADRFEPEKYRDEVKDRIQAAIEQKREGKEIAIAPEEQPKAQIIDLMEALKASLGEADANEDALVSKSKRAKKRSTKTKTS
ncbi:MAG: Ku protein [Myxococcales bacterium]|nr:Ku protein [Myxococcales bacterium]